MVAHRYNMGERRRGQALEPVDVDADPETPRPLERDLACLPQSSMQDGHVVLSGSSKAASRSRGACGRARSWRRRPASRVFKCMHIEAQDGTHPTYKEIFKVMAVACIVPLSNAVSERGFSTLGNIKTAEKSRMLPW